MTPKHSESSSQRKPSRPSYSIQQITVVILATRLILSSSHQIFFPFLPVIANGLRLTEVQLGRYIGLSNVTSMVAPFFGIIADKRGYRRVIQVGLFVTATGSLLIYFSHSLWSFVIGLFLIGAGSAGVAPTLSAYMSHLLPFEKRSRGLGMLEYTYAFTGIAVFPIFGWLMGWTSWRIPFLIMGVLELVAIVGFLRMPGTGREEGQTTSFSLSETFGDLLEFGPNWRSAAAVLASDSLIKLAGTVLNINFGTWLAREYGLGAGNLGQVSFILGLADICGSGLVSLYGDQIGKRRSVLFATGFGTLFYMLLPFWNHGYSRAMIGLILARWTFEFAIVANIILISEQSPEHRGKMLTTRMGLGFIAISLGSFVGPLLYEYFGAWGIGLPGALSMLAAWLVTKALTVERG